MQKGLVSVLTPCYNGEKLIFRLLDSLLQQDYPYLEIIIVDDGSTDKTSEIVLSYKNKFEGKGIQFRYIYQTNGGQSSAINNGLKYVNGEYLVWPDCDDWYNTPKAISTFVKELEKLPEEFAEVRCIPTYIDEKELLPLSSPDFKKEFFETNQFTNCLYDNGFIWGAGNYLLRMEAFDRVNPQREIYVEKNAGQNWQMHLPVLYSYKVHTIKASLFNVLKRAESHSRGQYKTYSQIKDRLNAYEKVCSCTLNTISEISIREKNSYLLAIRVKYVLQRFMLAMSWRKYDDAIKSRNILEKENINIENRYYRILFKYGDSIVALFILNESMRIVKRAKRSIKSCFEYIKNF